MAQRWLAPGPLLPLFARVCCGPTAGQGRAARPAQLPGRGPSPGPNPKPKPSSSSNPNSNPNPNRNPGPAPPRCLTAATFAVAVPRAARKPLPLRTADTRLQMTEAAMAEPLRPQVPLAARMRYHRDEARVGQKEWGGAGSAGAAPSPSMTTARGATGGRAL